MNYRPTILVADSSSTFVLSVSTLFDRMSFDVIPVDNGEDTIAFANKYEPEIILLSLDLTGLNESRVLQYLQENLTTSQIPVILTSAFSTEHHTSYDGEMGHTEYVSIPMHISKLYKTLQDLIIFPGGKKRRYLRTEYYHKVLVTHNGFSSSKQALSLSEGGIYIRYINPIAIGEEVTVTLPLRVGEAVKVQGSVIYTRGIYGTMFNLGPGMAIKFNHLSNDIAHKIKSYILNLLTEDIPDDHILH